MTNRFKETTIISDAFNQLPESGGKNRFFQSFGEDNTANLGLHPDHHSITMLKVNQVSETFRMMVTNDGGVYFSNTDTIPGEVDGDWIFAGNGYNTSQFYGADKKTGSLEFIGGMQDNGTYRSPSGQDANENSSYIRQVGGDGFKVAWHHTDPDMIVASSQYNGFRRTTDGGASWTSGTIGLDDVGEDNAPFISWLANSKKRPSILYAVGRQGVWKSLDFSASWELKPINANWGFNNLSRVAISEADPAIVWAGSGMTATSRLHFSDDNGNSFTPVNNFTGVALGNITNIATHPTQRKTAFVLFSFSDGPKILRTTDSGDNWMDISGFGTNSESDNGFPDVPVFSLVVHPHNPSTIWAGTEIGIVESTDNGETWALLDDFLNVSVWDMKLIDDQVLVATHGRGLWSVTLEGLSWPSELVTAVTEIPTPNELSIINFPNPVSEATIIRYNLPTATTVRIDIITIDGRLVSSRDLGAQKSGQGQMNWYRDPLLHTSGIYLLRIATGLGTTTSRMIIE